MNLRRASGAPLPRWLRLFAIALLLCVPLAAMPATSEQEIAQGVISRMEHVAVDYPYVVREGEVLDNAEYQGLREFASESLALLQQLPAQTGQQALVAQMQRMVASIDERAPGPAIAVPARAVAAELMRMYRLTAAPRETPNLRRAQALYRLECAACHGERGRGDGPAAVVLQPPPGDFLDRARMEDQSILALYDAITTGVSGQPGHGAHLPFADRWALAFLVSSLRDPPDLVRRGQALWGDGKGQAQLPDLRSLVLPSPAQLEQEGGSTLDAVRAFLTAHPEALDGSRPVGLVLARTALRDVVPAYARGDVEGARQLALAAYEEGLLPLADQLDAADPALRREIAGELQALRAAIEARDHSGVVAAHAARIESLLDRAAGLIQRGTRAARAVYLGALLVLLREGVEAILVLAALAAVARKTGSAAARRSIHGGWMAAVLLGVGTWYAAGEFIAMAEVGREVAEGLTTLLAAAMLLYVGGWLHRRAPLEAWHAFLGARMAGANTRRALWVMGGLAFLALFRELFELVLLVQALWARAGPERHRAVLAGLGTGAALLAALAWLVGKYGARLPLASFQSATSAVLVLTALVFVGDGISALQEAEVLPATAVRFVTLPLLGIHPTAQGLGAQAAVALLIATCLVLDRRRTQR